MSLIIAYKSLFEGRKNTQLTELVITAKSDTLKKIYEKQLEEMAEKLEGAQGKTTEGVDISIPYRTALHKSKCLLKSPYKIWKSLDVLEQQRLFFFIFEEKLPYSKKAGYRTDNLPYAARLFEDFATSNTQDVEITTRC